MADRLNGYVTLGGEAEAEIEEKKSVFIAHAAPIASEEAAQRFIKEIKEAYADARHNVYAYLLDHGAVARCSDDGEPQGTAGVVLLDVLKKNGVTNAVIVVTRYFGGILLGAPGLVRAYSAAATAGVRAAGIVRMVPYLLFSITCSYSEHPRLKKALSGLGCIEEGTEFGEGVTVRASILKERFDSVSDFLKEFASGQLHAEISETVMRPASGAENRE